MKAISNAFWLSFSRVFADVLSFVLFTVISQQFGPAGSGEYSYAFAVGSLVALLATSGFEEYGIRQYVYAAQGARAQVWRNIMSTQCVQMAIGIAALALFLLLGGSHEASVLVVLELSFYLAAFGLGHTLFVPAMAAQSMVKPAFLDLGCRVGAILLALGLLLLAHAPLYASLSGFPIAGLLLIMLGLRNATDHGASWQLDVSPAVVRSTWGGTVFFAGSEVLNQFYARTDLLLIAFLLGTAQVGLYATDIKFVEVGLLPLVLLGTAVYPVLSGLAAQGAMAFRSAARDLIRIQMFLSGWLAVAISVLIPLLIVPLFGTKFQVAARLLPWFSALAIVKGGEIALYRLLYSVRRQPVYFRSLVFGTVFMVVLNVILIPRAGVIGAVGAAIIGTTVVVVVCAHGLASYVGPAALIGAIVRLVLALVLVAVSVEGVTRLGVGPWWTALTGCALYPAVAFLTGLVPDPRRSMLFARHRGTHGPVEEASSSVAQAEALGQGVGPDL